MPSLFAQRIQAAISSHRLLRRETRVLAGVSGGADSVALVLVLRELGYSLGIAHLNHGLRGTESEGDERFVRELAERLAVPSFFEKVELKSAVGNIEAAGRAARKNFFESVSRNSDFEKIALGHHRNDRVETFLLNLMRGAGGGGLAAMSMASAGPVIRPLLDVSRTDIEAYLRSQGQVWRTDSTNQDLRFARNRLRHVVIPELELKFNPRVVDTIARAMVLLDDEGRWIEDHAAAWMDSHAVKVKGDGAVTDVPHVADVAIDAEALLAAPVALQRRVVRLALSGAGSPLTNVGFERIEAIRALAAPGRSGRMVEAGGETTVSREFGSMVFRRRPAAMAEGGGAVAYELPVPGEVWAPELGRTFRATILDRPDRPEGPDRVFVDGVALGPYVTIRLWKPGDYYRPVGWPSGKLKKLFQRARIPKNRRSELPVFVAASGIVWVASFPVSREFAPSGCSQGIGAPGFGALGIVVLEALPSRAR